MRLSVTFPESWCGFLANRGTVDMIFSARQLQEKCRELNISLYHCFIDLSEAFDTVNRSTLEDFTEVGLSREICGFWFDFFMTGWRLELVLVELSQTKYLLIMGYNRVTFLYSRCLPSTSKLFFSYGFLWKSG